jgi:hypothetical protein
MTARLIGWAVVLLGLFTTTAAAATTVAAGACCPICPFCR